MRRYGYLILLLPALAGCKPTDPLSGPRSHSTVSQSVPASAPATQADVSSEDHLPVSHRRSPFSPDIGQPAPSLEGVDAEGRTLKLSDDRGKVVVVDFWATWCGPCRDMIPHERELVKRMRGRPFVLLGVSNDGNPQDIKQFMEKEQMDWPNIIDGATSPRALAWFVGGYPTVDVVDAKGVYRYASVDDASLDAVVDKLVKEAERGK